MRITEMVVSTADKKLEPQILPRVTADINTELKVLNVYRDAKRQTWLGFGSALTEAAAYCYAQLPEDKKKEVLRLFYSKEGLGYELGRMHIGSCDFATQEYAYTEPGDREMKTFDLGQDRKYVLPMVKDIVAAAPELFLFASPWSPPPWMKSNGSTRAGGELLDEWKTPWAEYVARYLESYAAEGVQIPAMTVQNEPWAAQTWESCRYTAEGEAELIRDHLGPVLDAHGIPMKFIIWDHNKERVYERARDTLRDPAVRERVWGIGFHWYSGDHFDALGLTHEAFPDKVLIETEYCLGMSRGGAKDGTMQYAREILGDMNNGMQAAVDWNLLLDQTGGPYHYRYTGCAAPVHVNTDTKELTLQPSYYGLAHFSKYIPKGSVRLATSSYDRDLTITAFERPDGKIAVVAINEAQEEKSAFLRMSDHSAPLTLAPRSVATIVIEE
ncbi:MAG TPA: glucosylceramidase [Candidatus Ruminococcus gallistercoris]|nr:glucosylceramidase [Candidatus Ruminococcus gallistercoris]